MTGARSTIDSTVISMHIQLLRNLESIYLMVFLLLAVFSQGLLAGELPPAVRDLVQNRCIDCHDAVTKKGDLDLDGLRFDPANPENFARWVKIYDRVESGEMPPKKRRVRRRVRSGPRSQRLKQTLNAAEDVRLAGKHRTALRRLTRVEYENHDARPVRHARHRVAGNAAAGRLLARIRQE